MQSESSSVRQRLMYVGLALCVAVVYDVLFWHNSLGMNFLLFVAAYTIGFSTLLVVTKRLYQPWSLGLAVAALIMAVTPLMYRNDMVIVGVPFFVFVLLFLFSAIAPLQNPLKRLFHFSKIPMISSIGRPFVEMGGVYHDFWSGSSGRKLVIKRILMGIIVAIPLLFVFGLLFYHADEVFATWVRHIEVDGLDLWRLCRTLIIALLLSSFFYGFLKSAYELGEKTRVPRKEDAIIVSVILLLLNVFFAVFVFIQFHYLFAGKDYVFENGITFATYARKGFFELVAVVALTGVILMTVYRSFAAHGRHWVVNVLQLLLILQVVGIGASAIKRLNLYQDAYGFTIIRLYSEWLLYFMLATMLWAGVCIIGRISFRRLFHISLAGGLIVLIGVVCMNVDYLIARRNVERHIVDGKELDLYYLSRLSSDVVPALVPLFSEERIAVLSNDQNNQKEMIVTILQTLEREHGKRDRWFEYHFGVAQAYRDVDSHATPAIAPLREKARRSDRFQEIAGQMWAERAHLCPPTFRQFIATPGDDCYLFQANGKTYAATLSQTHEYAVYEQGQDGLAYTYTEIYRNQLPYTATTVGRLFYISKEGKVLEVNYETAEIFAYEILREPGMVGRLGEKTVY